MNIKGTKVVVDKKGIKHKNIITPVEVKVLHDFCVFSKGIDIEWAMINTKQHKKYVIEWNKRATEAQIQNKLVSTKHCYLGNSEYAKVVLVL